MHTDLIEKRLEELQALKKKLANEIAKEKKELQGNSVSTPQIVQSSKKPVSNSEDVLVNSYLEKREKLSETDYLSKILPIINKIPESNGSKFFDKINVNIGIIADEFLFQSYKDTANFFYVNQKNYKDLVKKLDFFIVVTAWKGLNNEWRGISNESSKRREELLNIISFYKAKGLKIVFYSKEDPVNYDKFVGIAKECDYIFTTEVDKIKDYKKDCNNQNAFLLEFGVNPLYHNPIGMKTIEKKDEAFFAGSWYDKYPDRQVDTKMLFEGVLYSGKNLKIIDRNYNLNDPSYFYPEEYLQYISPAINHEHLQKVHKLYNWALNLNSIKYSFSMFANRVYEMQALGNAVISNYSLAINNKFPNVFLVNSSREVSEILNGYTNDQIYELQISGIRQVMSKETTFNRLSDLLKQIGENPSEVNRRIAVVVNEINKSIEKSFNRQTYQDKDLILVKDFNEEIKKRYSIITFFDPSKEYFEYYLEDMINGFKYTNSDYITKDGYKDGNQIVSGKEHQYTHTMPDKYRTVFWAQSFSAKELINFKGSIEIPNGYSIDRFEFDNKIKIENKSLRNSSYKLSVIIPVYNNGKYLLYKCFNSLRRSSIFDSMEIILVDDGSTQSDTLITMNRLQREFSNVKTYFYTDNGSGSASRPRNKGIELATAPYITYLDPDNEAINDGYSELLENIENDRTIDMVVGNIDKIDNVKSVTFNYYNTVIKNNKSEIITDPLNFLKNADLRAQSIQALVVKKGIILDNNIKMVEKAGGQDTLFFHELILKSKKIKAINLSIHIYYAAVEGSVTNSITKKFFEKYFILEKERLPFLKKNGLFETFIEKRFVFYFKNWYLKRLPNVKEEDLEKSLEILYNIYLMYRDSLKKPDLELKEFEKNYKKGKYKEIITMILKK
jgi:glycosyltransferase involved in cell wall biosynthesis